MLKRSLVEHATERAVEGKARRVASDCDEQKTAEPGQAVQLASVGEIGILPSSSEADTTCEVCEGEGASNSVGSSVPNTVTGEFCAEAAHPVSDLGLHHGSGEASGWNAKSATDHKVKKSVRFAHGPIDSTPDGHPVSEGTTMVARAPSPYNLFTPVKPVEALTKHSLTAMERELGEDFREENAMSLVRLKRRVCLLKLASAALVLDVCLVQGYLELDRKVSVFIIVSLQNVKGYSFLQCGIIPLKPIPRPFATSFSKPKLAVAFKAQASKKE